MDFSVIAPIDTAIDRLGTFKCLMQNINSRQRAHAPTNFIALIISSNPKILNTRLKLYANTLNSFPHPHGVIAA